MKLFTRFHNLLKLLFLQENLTALHVACNSGSKALVTYLIENGANLTAKDDNEFTPLITASMKGSLECVSAVFETRFPPSLEQMDVVRLCWSAVRMPTNFLLLLIDNYH